MMPNLTLSPGQLRALQTLWPPFAVQARIDAKDRAARLIWVSSAVGRSIESFSELHALEAAQLIDQLKRTLGQAVTPARRRPSNGAARAYGTAGRRGRGDKEIRLADANTLGLLDSLRQRLGWTREQLDVFLRGPKSPVRSGAIRTLGEANRVIWVFKSMLRRRANSENCEADATLRRAG